MRNWERNKKKTREWEKEIDKRAWEREREKERERERDKNEMDKRERERERELLQERERETWKFEKVLSQTRLRNKEESHFNLLKISASTSSSNQ